MILKKLFQITYVLCFILQANNAIFTQESTKLETDTTLTPEQKGVLNLANKSAPLLFLHNLLLHPAFSQYVQDILSSKNNPYCFNIQTKSYIPNCTYDIRTAFQYLLGATPDHPWLKDTWSNIPKINKLDELDDLKFISQITNKDFYLVVYKSGCIPCAQALSFLESQISEIQAQGNIVSRIFSRDISDQLSKQLNITGTPTFFKINHKYSSYTDPALHNFVQEIPLSNISSELLGISNPIPDTPNRPLNQNNSYLQTLGNIVKDYKEKQNRSQNALKYWHPYYKHWNQQTKYSNFEKNLMNSNPFL